MTTLNASTAGALKTLVESAGLGITAFRDRPVDELGINADGTLKPYVTIHEELALVPDAGAEEDPDGTGKETAQLDLWQSWRVPATGAVAESYTLPRRLHAALKGAQLPSAPDRVYSVIVRNRIRLVERDENIVHHAYTLEIVRQLIGVPA